MLKLKHQYFGHLMERTDSLEKTPMLGKIAGRRRGNDRGRDGWMALLTQSTSKNTRMLGPVRSTPWLVCPRILPVPLISLPSPTGASSPIRCFLGWDM